MDFFGRDCRQWITYDGYSDSLFCLNKTHLFKRELLDPWLWDLCGTGSTFRDVFSSWMTKGLASSGAFHRLGREIGVPHTRANEAFSLFLKTLIFPHDEDLYSLISCYKSQLNPDSPSRYLSGVVMDGTALGILGILPYFQRETRLFLQFPELRTSSTLCETQSDGHLLM